ncbi:MAG: protein kinase [Gemmataceae bacterium]|nr:protein kinase [Gemmataceae bacterium]
MSPHLAPPTPPSEADALVLRAVAGPLSGQAFNLRGHSSFLAGRGPGALQLLLENDPGISRTHFLIECNPPLARLVDLRSKNGTYLNDARIDEAGLRHGDRIRAGQTVLLVELPGGPGTLTVEPPSPPTQPDNRAVFPGFKVERELGRGGMGIVFLATRLADNQAVAIKAVSPAVAPSGDALARFQREMAILERLTHPHIVRFLQTGESGGLLFFVMEYVEGTSASAAVREHGPFAPERVVRIGCQLLEALAHAHLQGFVHRDVKPGNLLLTPDDSVKLADFGLGRTYQASMMSGLTISGQPGGTPGFMPPEQVLDFRSARPAADQYGAAATLYFMLTGQMVYEPARSTAELLTRILAEEPIPLRPAPGPSLGRLGPVLCRALARDPRHRYPDVLAFRDALRSRVCGSLPCDPGTIARGA